ncbi:MAG: aldehyde ferredoxin oxidoreductase, partial [Chloroflexi bacterium]|nr:aldehyde ferredoxin oxidoreductase [Chloroflexota bacterium]
MPSSSVYGYTGKILRVDLTNERFSEEMLGEADLRKWVGGVGFGVKYLYDEVPEGVEWNDAENRLVFASGPLGGTRAPGSGTFSLVTKGPLTNLAAASQANGYFGAYMKFSGFDAVIVQGAAQRPVYLYLHDGIGELRDASHLKGKDIWETEALIKKELEQREQGMSVMAIGPAGENLVKFAAVGGDRGHFAGTNGTGAVMGSKNLKAIAAARGKGLVTVKDTKRLSSLATEMFED